VADTSAATDRQLKVPLYARTGIVEVWLVVLPSTRRGRRAEPNPELATPWLEMYRRPSPDGYGEVRIVRRGERISPELLPEVALTLDDLVGE
jgi:Uma2 family endonuclease